MKNRKLLSILAMLLAVALPAFAVFTGMDLDATLYNLRRELFHDWQQKSQTQERLQHKYEVQHAQMVDIVKKCNDLSLMLYSQKQDYTFDISYALEKVSQEYRDFNKNRTPYDRIVSKLDVEINRYARLIEALRRLPPELEKVSVIPDSLAYHNDTLDAHLQHNESLLQQELQEKVDAILALKQAKNASSGEESVPPFILSKQGQTDRDTCLSYASQLLQMFADSREMAVADSIHYREAQLRMEESYKYARDYYAQLEKKVFVEGQTPWLTILSHPGEYWKEAIRGLGEKYSDSFLEEMLVEGQSDEQMKERILRDDQAANSAKAFWLLVYFLAFFALWGLSFLILGLLCRHVKTVGKRIAREQKPYLALLLGCLLFLIFSQEMTNDDIVRKIVSIMHTFIGLLMAINTALLIRLKPSKLRDGVRMYLPTIFTALLVIICRVLFVPNAFLNFFFPPFLLGFALWQLAANLHSGTKVDKTDVVFGWISFGITAVAMGVSWAGYIFLALIILAWWYFQLALILAVASIWDLTILYRENRLSKRLSSYRARITYVTGPAKERLMFGATWFYDLIREVLIPLMVLCSIPACIYWALSIFEFTDLYRSIFENPFFRQGGADGIRISLESLLRLAAIFCLLRYLNKAAHTIWQSFQYHRFLRKYNRKSVRSNEINLSLGNSLISVFIWFVYADIVIITLNIPTGSLGLIAGGLSAGIGLALKDIINNFIYGIQLMGGRLRVGDWIECDGIRGKVTDINYLTTLVETLYGTQVAFLNSTLFGMNFTNLTRNNSYELTIVKVGVAYGTNFPRVREALEKGLEALRTKDAYGREIVEPTYGIYVRFDDFGDSSVNVAVRQYVLVPEQIEYVYQCKELIYRILAENGITIPFPQRDVHLIPEKVE